MFSVEEKINHLKKLGFEGNLDEIKKMYSGENFNPSDENYKKLVKLSHNLCNEFNQMSGKASNSNPIVAEFAERRKKEILDTLFPGHGMFFGGRDGIKAVVGLVDVSDFCYLNGNIDFGQSNLVSLQPYVFLAQNLRFGSPLNIDKDGKTKLDNIKIDHDTWVGANCTFGNGVEIPNGCVVAMGSSVNKGDVLFEKTLILNSRKYQKVKPARSVSKIESNYESAYPNLPFDRTEDEVKQLVRHVQKLGIKGDFTEYKKLLHNKTHNALDPTVGAIYDLTHKLCSEYNFGCKGADKQKRKQEILDILFPVHGKNLKVGNNLMCDVMGSVELGDNVTIGDNVSLAGNISVGDNVKIGNDVVLQGIGHNVYFEDRRLPANGPMREDNTSAGIFVCNNLNLADGTLVGPNVWLNHNTEKDELVTRTKNVVEIENETYIMLDAGR